MAFILKLSSLNAAMRHVLYPVFNKKQNIILPIGEMIDSGKVLVKHNRISIHKSWICPVI